MTASIVACGDSAKEWFKTPHDFSVGVNDCVKFGHEVDHLVVINSPGKFNPSVHNGHSDRMKTITDSKPKKFYCHNSNWRKWFRHGEMIAMKQFNSTYMPGRVYFSKTSPIVAITLAVKLGATELILWGIDMLNHHRFHPGEKDQVTEIGYYSILFEQLENQGVKVWLGNGNSALKAFLPVYKSISSNTMVMDQ